jgi:hypothetical protein
MSIHVEIDIRGSFDDLWRLTQTPQLHQQWDLRFTTISYLPRPDPAKPQRFAYATRIGMGMEIQGWGQTISHLEQDGSSISSLEFGSDDRRSLIRHGSGYWKYIQTNQGLRFITGYNYHVRFGTAGRLVDQLLFRPLMGWATAWSFDRLRLWIEQGTHPRQAARQAIIHTLATAAVSFVWLWHGLVPKLLGPHPQEVRMLLDAGVTDHWAHRIVTFAGWFEIILGLLVLWQSRKRWPWLLTIGLMAFATAGVLICSPDMAKAAFNPVTLNTLLASMAGVGMLTLRDLPSARRCRRRPSAVVSTTARAHQEAS